MELNIYFWELIRHHLTALRCSFMVCVTTNYLVSLNVICVHFFMSLSRDLLSIDSELTPLSYNRLSILRG